jgi:hypothetical protein
MLAEMVTGAGCVVLIYSSLVLHETRIMKMRINGYLFIIAFKIIVIQIKT